MKANMEEMKQTAGMQIQSSCGLAALGGVNNSHV